MPESMQLQLQAGTQASCSCRTDTASLANSLPMEAEVPFESVIKCGQRLRGVWERANICRCGYLDSHVVRTLAAIADRVVTLYEAASSVYKAYSPSSSKPSRSMSNVSSQPIKSSSSDGPLLPVCVKSQITLGEILIENEEAGLLATTVLSNDLSKLSVLLRNLRNHLQASQGNTNHPATQFGLREVEAYVCSTLSKLHILIDTFGT